MPSIKGQLCLESEFSLRIQRLTNLFHNKQKSCDGTQSYRCKQNISFCRGGNKRSSGIIYRLPASLSFRFCVRTSFRFYKSARWPSAGAHETTLFRNGTNFYLFGRDPHRCGSVTDPRVTTMTCVIIASRQQLSKRRSTMNFPRENFEKGGDRWTLKKMPIAALLVQNCRIFYNNKHVFVWTNIYQFVGIFLKLAKTM